MAKFGDINNNPDSLSDLHATIKPHLLRRMKEDVEKNLPPKEETIIEVELTGEWQLLCALHKLRQQSHPRCRFLLLVLVFILRLMDILAS